LSPQNLRAPAGIRKADLKIFASPLRVVIFFRHPKKKKTVLGRSDALSDMFTITGGGSDIDKCGLNT
jgi:hypothetical protein